MNHDNNYKDENTKGYSYCSPDRKELFMYITKIYSLIGNIIDKYCIEKGLNESKLNALFVLSQNLDGMLLSELGKQLSLSKSAITKLVDSLEKDGLISRCNHPEDRRSTLAKITKEGVDTCHEILPKVNLIFDLGNKIFDDKEKEMAVNLLRKYYENMQNIIEEM